MHPRKENDVSEGKRRVRSTPRSSGEARANVDRASAPAMTVAVRRQTLEEQRRWDAAFDVFLAELVRQQLGRE